MKHVLESSLMTYTSLTVLEVGDQISIIVESNGNSEIIPLTKKELHSLIGTLLHVQAKMKGGSNG